MAQRALLLDLDGTLWDSRPWFADLLARLSGTPSVELESRLAAGVSVVRLATEQGVSQSRLASEARGRVATLDFYDSAWRTLDTLRDRTTPMGVVTNLPRWLVAPVTEATGVARYFEVIVTPRRGVPAKPKPHGISKALRDMGRAADLNTCFIGDGVADAEAAAAAGVRFAWASYGYDTDQPPGTETVLHSFEDVLRL